jgi:hypothetical protein
MALALFVSETYLKDFTPITSNVDIAMIWPHIKVYQDLHIQPILGSKLYEGLQARIIANTLTANDTALLDLCRQALVWGTLDQLIPFLAIQVRNKGVGSNTGENFESADLDKLKWLQGQAHSIFKFYAQRIQDYLCENGSLFSEYTNPDNPMVPDPTLTFDCGIYLGPSSKEDFDALEFWKRYIR